MLRRKILDGYVSQIDKLIAEFDKTHALTDSQRAEIKKYERIAKLRDVPMADKKAQIWEEF